MNQTQILKLVLMLQNITQKISKTQTINRLTIVDIKNLIFLRLEGLVL